VREIVLTESRFRDIIGHQPKESRMRKYTNIVLDLIDASIMSPMAIAEMCLMHMSEDDVKDMCLANDLLLEDEEDEDDGQPDEAQEWHDFDPEC